MDILVNSATPHVELNFRFRIDNPMEGCFCEFVIYYRFRGAFTWSNVSALTCNIDPLSNKLMSVFILLYNTNFKVANVAYFK
jgi:hypothetical protein